MSEPGRGMPARARSLGPMAIATPPATRLIALDWGTSSFRARRLDERGDVIETRRTADGILSVKDGAFEDRLRANLSDWLDPAVPCLASGMITSRQGWIETPYVSCPASHAAIVGQIVHHRLRDGIEIAFVPGVRQREGICDVMRGEETQILGVMDEGLAVHPGTHSKWALVESGAIMRFATFMTGELFAVLLDHSILGRLAEGRGDDAQAFKRGVEAGAHAAQIGDMTHELFGARALALAGALTPKAVGSYLSGLLIGGEIAAAPKTLRIGDATPVIFGGVALVEQYLAAFAALGRRAKRGPEDATIKGLVKIARLLRWL